MVEVEQRVCDLHSEPVEAVEEITVQIGVEEPRTLDVCEEHLQQVQQMLLVAETLPSPEAIRQPVHSVKKAAPAKKSRATRAGGYTPRQVRAWATASGIEVPTTGRLPQTVIEQYLAATS